MKYTNDTNHVIKTNPIKKDPIIGDIVIKVWMPKYPRIIPMSDKIITISPMNLMKMG